MKIEAKWKAIIYSVIISTAIIIITTGIFRPWISFQAMLYASMLIGAGSLIVSIVISTFPMYKKK
jgi:hypothetical protein